jgi:hypothetical protein
MDGDSGTFKVDKTIRVIDFRARVQYDGTRYLKHTGSGEIFLKGEPTVLRIFLHTEFDGTYYGENVEAEAFPNKGLHLYEPHTETGEKVRNGRMAGAKELSEH